MSTPLNEAQNKLDAVLQCRDPDILRVALHTLNETITQLMSSQDVGSMRVFRKEDDDFRAVSALIGGLELFGILGYQSEPDALKFNPATAMLTFSDLESLKGRLDSHANTAVQAEDSRMQRHLSLPLIKTLPIRFQVNFHVLAGQEMVVVGSCKELGNWDASLGKVMTYAGDGRWMADVHIKRLTRFEYKYCVRYAHAGNECIWEAGDNRIMTLNAHTHVRDTWQPALSESDFLMQRAAFRDVVYRRLTPRSLPPVRTLDDHVAVTFVVHAARVAPGQSVYVVGSIPRLGNWDVTRGLRMFDGDYPFWKASLTFRKSDYANVEYKYVLLSDADTTPDNASGAIWEAGPNRLLHASADEIADYTVINDGYFNTPSAIGEWRGAGFVVPVFSLRSSRSVGVGQFSDLRLAVDLAVKCKMRVLQTLPVNDTNIHMMWWDSYPYSSLSVFALHPIYIDLEDDALQPLPADIVSDIQMARKQLEGEKVDYENTLTTKLALLRRIYALRKTDFFASAQWKSFFDQNSWWLKDYAAFCFLRDKHKTANFRSWPDHIACTSDMIEMLCHDNADGVGFWYFTQYHLDAQLCAAARYAAEHGVFFKGDLPIGVDPLSVDVWRNPHLFRLNAQTGAPPDYFSRTGQNWGFPTYNWDAMAMDDYLWWRRRLGMMARYFHAYRIDHVLGFFRIWEIPDNCVTGILGHFYPANPVTRIELERDNIWDVQRLMQPHIRWHTLYGLFGEDAHNVRDHLLEMYGDDHYRFRAGLDSEKAVCAYANKERWDEVKLNKLYELLSNVCLVSDPDNVYDMHPRILMSEVSSFKELPQWQQERLTTMYVDYFFQRQDHLWRSTAMKRLNVMVHTTNMLVCGEDLGMIPSVVQGVLDEFHLLGLRVQRMPKDLKADFEDPCFYNYMSVCTPSVHDTSTLRAWWDEDAATTQKFWNTILQQYGQAPAHCTTDVAKSVVWSHLQSRSMLAMFAIQDLFAMRDDLRVSDPSSERINVPANRHHYWQYRLHVALEDLLANEPFIYDVSSMVWHAGRAAEN
eukprot:TRINITY_DN14049_c0_g1_i1.p1 TRINITY_DN14049_c0_g1~~TRINITY_DN14049_c0_g1_i1.p1  ORF type:complete len:1082 (-),score=226.96 TRINITY_DN14049_c0_g1_i1:85-3183(-)